MTDRELLELAAKAAGFVPTVNMNNDTVWRDANGSGCFEWNPLTAEIDALVRDAERYRCLKKTRDVLLLTAFFGNGCVNRTIEEVDAAIDAAIEETPK